MPSDEEPKLKIREHWLPGFIGERDDLGRGLVHDFGANESYALIKGVKYLEGSPEYLDVFTRIHVLGLGWKKATKDIKVVES
jgi:hypothetical protein